MSRQCPSHPYHAPVRLAPCDCRSWEEERATLQAQIEALKRGEGKSPGRRRTNAAGDGDDSDEDDELQELREQLNEAREKEVGLQGVGTGRTCGTDVPCGVRNGVACLSSADARVRQRPVS